MHYPQRTEANTEMSAESGVAIRTLQLFRSLHPDVGGPLTYLIALNSALDHSPIETTAAAFEPVPKSIGIELAYRAPDSHVILKAWHLTYWLLGQLKHFDLVHIHGMYGWHTVFASLACQKTGKPYVLSTHGHLFANALFQKQLKKHVYLSRLGRWILRHANSVVATTEIEKLSILAVEPLAKVTVVSPGIHLPHIQDTSTPKSGRLEIVFLGRLHPHKQIPLLLEALASIKAEQAVWRLSIAGTGDTAYVAYLRELAQRLGLAQQVTFLGHLTGDRKEKLLRQSHMLVLPSLSENFSFSVAEALAHGVPAVVTNEVGLAKWVRVYQCGAVVPVGDVQALSQAIIDLGCDVRRQQAAKAARSCAEHVLSLKRMREELLDLYIKATAVRFR